jgi:hypothetical protein
MVDYSKWDRLANSMGDDYDAEDEDSRREWMSRYTLDETLRCVQSLVSFHILGRWDQINQEQEEQWRGETCNPARQKTSLRDQLGLPGYDGPSSLASAFVSCCDTFDNMQNMERQLRLTKETVLADFIPF